MDKQDTTNGFSPDIHLFWFVASITHCPLIRGKSLHTDQKEHDNTVKIVYQNDWNWCKKTPFCVPILFLIPVWPPFIHTFIKDRWHFSFSLAANCFCQLCFVCLSEIIVPTFLIKYFMGNFVFRALNLKRSFAEQTTDERQIPSRKDRVLSGKQGIIYEGLLLLM